MAWAVSPVVSVLMGCCFQLKEAGQAAGSSSLPPSLMRSEKLREGSELLAHPMAPAQHPRPTGQEDLLQSHQMSPGCDRMGPAPHQSEALGSASQGLLQPIGGYGLLLCPLSKHDAFAGIDQ